MSKNYALVLLLILSTTGVSANTGFLQGSCSPLLNHDVEKLVSGEPVNLCDAYSGKVVLVVNTASKCAFTPQYEALEELYEKYKERGLVVLGFPSNDFGHQEPGSEEQIRDFCRMTYGVQFPMFAKTRVLGPDAEPFYRYLADVTGDTPRWNFHKYLLDREGRVVASFPSQVGPDDERLVTAIEALL